MNKTILIAYASVSGSTGEVAEAIGEVVGEAGVAVQVRNVKDVSDVSVYNAVVLGSSIRVGRWLPEAVEFLETYQDDLQQVPVAYFTTCLTMVHDTEDSHKTVLSYMEPLLQLAPQIKPVGLGLFAGSLDPTRRLMMQTTLAPQGDYRDWEAIRAWAKEIRPQLLEGHVETEEPMILRGAVLSYTDLAGADLGGADLHGAELQEVNLREADLHEADLDETELIKADLQEANLHQAGLRWADLNRADMSGANLQGANLIGADLNRVNLSRAILSRAVLNGANLSQANLQGADLSYADLNWVDLRGADLSQANLSQASLGWANLREANLSQANLSQVRYNNQTEWPEDFSPETRGAILIEAEPY